MAGAVGGAAATAVTTDRRRDFRAAAMWLEEGIGAGLGDVEIANDRPIRDVVTEIVHWLGWL